jgi:hypothetical protein
MGILRVLGVLGEIVVYWGIPLTVISFIYVKLLYPLRQQRLEHERLLATGTQCSGHVLQVHEAPLGGTYPHRLRLVLEVSPTDSMPYRAETVVFVSAVELPRVQPGCDVTVRYDPMDPTRVTMEAANPLGQVFPPPRPQPPGQP